MLADPGEEVIRIDNSGRMVAEGAIDFGTSTDFSEEAKFTKSC